MSIALIGVGTSASENIFLLPDLDEYKFCFEGSPAMIGIDIIIESFMSSVLEIPGTIYAYLPFIKERIRLIVFGL
jgi:hypothetical protein